MDERISAEAQKTVSTETHVRDTETTSTDFSYNELNAFMTESGPATIRRILSSYDIGQKIRKLRLRKKIALVDLGKHTGLSASMLSQLENGKLVPTLGTLARIALVFDVGLDYFFGDRKGRRPFTVIRAHERIRFPDKPTSERPDYFFECLAYATQDKTLHAYLAEFPNRVGEDVTEHAHDGAEFIHVIEGTLVVRQGGEDNTLNQGDSVYFDSAEPHSYRGASPDPAKALVVTVPPPL